MADVRDSMRVDLSNCVIVRPARNLELGNAEACGLLIMEVGMGRRAMLAFAKFFENDVHADDFIGGSLFMQKLSYFKGLEDEADKVRGDRNEATAAWLQPDNLEITFSEHPELNITGKDLAAPVSIAFDFHNHLHVFCMSAIRMEDPAGYGEIDREVAEVRLRKSTQLDQRCLTEFGPVAVVVPFTQFIERFNTVGKASGLKIRAALVDYYDETTFDGHLDYKEIPFKKQLRYAYQQEFRICINTQNPDDVMRFELGDMSAFCAKMHAADVNNAFQIKVSEHS